ncbi:MAG: BamA/TamA family outer membrane protein, partial [Planctomycetota bacterium]
NVSATYEYTGGPLGAELDLSKVNAWAALHRTVFSRGEARRHILSWKNSISWAEPHHNTGEVPIYERFYLGGSRSLRGFDYRRVGPHFGNEPIGGAVRHFGTLEYTFPLADDIIRGVGFIDYGNLSPTLQAFHGGDYRLSVGGGILINVPFLGQHLPMSFTWGDALLSEDGDKERQFLFDIGFGF